MATKKPVFEINVENIAKASDYKYQAIRYVGNAINILASDSLKNLKREIRERGWKLAWLTTNTGCFSYGQKLCDEYPYQPRN